MTIRSNKIKAAAREQDCTIAIAGVCKNRTFTTVLIHLPFKGAGMARKETDISSCFACSDCHDVVDGRVKDLDFELHRHWYLRRAMVRTWAKLVEMGLVVIK